MKQMMNFCQPINSYRSRAYPKFSGDHKEATKLILEDSSIPPSEFSFSVSKIFIKHPEIVFSLEEQRDINCELMETTLSKDRKNEIVFEHGETFSIRLYQF